MTRLLVTGDLHLGAGVDRFGPERLNDQEHVWQQIVDLALEEDVHALLFLGDAFERRRPSPAELLAFQRPLAQFHREVLYVTGNHCVEHPDRPIAAELFAYDRLEVHREPGLWPLRGVTMATLPWTPVARLVAQAGGGDRDDLNVVAAEHLLAVARGLRAQIDGAAILALHWSVSGAALPSGLPIEMAREPILPLAELEAMGWDAIVMGHIHKPQNLGAYPTPVGYVGSPLPLNFGEAGDEHGCWLLDHEAREVRSWRFVPLSSRRFLTVDLDPAELIEADPGTGWDVRDAIVRARYTCTQEQARKIDNVQLRRLLLDAGAFHATVEATIEREVKARAAGLDETLDLLDAFRMFLDENHIDGARADTLTGKAREFLAEAAT